jgi:hypothetical protein
MMGPWKQWSVVWLTVTFSNFQALTSVAPLPTMEPVV